MQLADCSPPAPSTHDRASQGFSGQNQKAYLRLKLALSLNLRRQIFLAVCDDLALRNRLAARLYAELGYSSPKPLAIEEAAPLSLNAAASLASPLGNRLSVMADDRTVTLPNPALPSRLLYPRLVSLNLNLSDPNPMVQIAEWLAQYPPPKGTQQRSRSPGFQILGTERLTRQPALVQKRFLSSLQQVEHYLSCLESPLLLWLPRPWLNAVQQSAPNFWNWRTALFEFEGDPTPVPSVTARLHSHPANTAKQSAVREAEQRQQAAPTERLPSAATVAATVVPLSDRAPISSTVEATSDATIAEATIAPTVTTSSSTTPTSKAPTARKDNLWDILTHDLALLKTGGQPTAPTSEPLDAEPPDHTATSTESALLPAIAASVHSAPPSALGLQRPPTPESGSARQTCGRCIRDTHRNAYRTCDCSDRTTNVA